MQGSLTMSYINEFVLGSWILVFVRVILFTQSFVCVSNVPFRRRFVD
jgi:hypothetical protein